jgi:hypothetical protein
MATSPSTPPDALEPFYIQRDLSPFAGGLFEFLGRTPLYRDVSDRLLNIAIPLFAWLPLLVLSAFEGHLFRGSIATPFLPDVEVHVRLLVALPLLIVAGKIAGRQMRPLLHQFLDESLIPKDAMPEFEAAVSSACRLRDSVLCGLLLIAFVYGVGIFVIWRQYVALDTASWYAASATQGSGLSLAGIWYAFVSLPLFQFVLCRWYFLLLIWTRFLWQISRIKLSLIPTHPDRMGGLGLLSEMTRALTVFAIAHGALLAGWLATRVVFLGAPLTEFKVEVAAMLIFVLCLTLGPLLVFAPPLRNARRQGLREYRTLAMDYVREFEKKWLRGGTRSKKPLMGSADIQSLADLGNSYNLVQGMRSTPITRAVVLRFVAATLLPVVPLLLTMMPLEAVVKKLGGILF